MCYDQKILRCPKPWDVVEIQVFHNQNKFSKQRLPDSSPFKRVRRGKISFVKVPILNFFNFVRQYILYNLRVLSPASQNSHWKHMYKTARLDFSSTYMAGQTSPTASFGDTCYWRWSCFTADLQSLSFRVTITKYENQEAHRQERFISLHFRGCEVWDQAISRLALWESPIFIRRGCLPAAFSRGRNGQASPWGLLYKAVT